MSDRNQNQPVHPRETERYAELADLMGDLGAGVPINPKSSGFNAADSTSLENALATVDRQYVPRPKEVAISDALVRPLQTSGGFYSRATPVGIPLQPRTRETVGTTIPTTAAAVSAPVQGEMNDTAWSDEDAFQSVLDGLEGDLLDVQSIEQIEDENFASEMGATDDGLFAAHTSSDNPSLTRSAYFEAPRDVPVVAQGAVLGQTAAISAPAAEQDYDFLSEFSDSMVETGDGLDMFSKASVPADGNHIAASTLEPLMTSEPIWNAGTHQAAPARIETTAQNIAPAINAPLVDNDPLEDDLTYDFEDVDFGDGGFDDAGSELPDASNLSSQTAAAATATRGLASILGSMRANASRESQATKSELPVASQAAFAANEADVDTFFPDVADPYQDVPVTGSLKVPEFIVADAPTSARVNSYDDFELDDFEPVAAPPIVKATLEIHETAQKISSNADDFADVDFASAFDASFNPTDELAELVGSNVEPDPIMSVARDDYFAPMPAMPPIEAAKSGRGKWLAFGAVGLALFGALAVYGSSGDSVDSGEAPAIVRADNEPVRVAPDNPGGTVVPNQDRVVFNEVGSGNAVPEAPQETLVDGRQEPAIAVEPVKEENRILNGDTTAEPIAESGTAIAPRAVQTVTVRPDGTLVVNEPVAPLASAPQADIVPETRPTVAAAQPLPEADAPVAEVAAAPVAETPSLAASPEDAALKEIAEAEVAPNVPVRVVELKPVTQKPKVKTQQAGPAEALDIVPSRPSDQPVNIVNPQTPTVPEQASEQQIAAAAPAAQADALAAGAYAIQIASTPSEEAATSTLRSLSGKFGSVLGGKDYAIQRAEVPGKGTVYRVRILAGSKADAAKLCARYKSAGGSCFVTR